MCGHAFVTGIFPLIDMISELFVYLHLSQVSLWPLQMIRKACWPYKEGISELQQLERVYLSHQYHWQLDIELDSNNC